MSAYWWRLWRPLYPEQLLVHEDVQAQGRRLGEWVLECFQTLAENPPPA